MIHVRYAKSHEGPHGWPADCAESDSTDLLPGYDAVMSNDELKTLQDRLSSEYSVWLADQDLPGKEAAAKANSAAADAITMLQSPDPITIAVKIALEAVVTLINDQLESAGQKRVLESAINQKIAEIVGGMDVSHNPKLALAEAVKRGWVPSVPE